MGTSKSRKMRHQGEKPGAQTGRPLQAVPEPEPAPQPEPPADRGGLELDMELDFKLPPMDLLYAEGAIPQFPKKTVYADPAFGAHWQQFLMANPDLKSFNRVVLAALRVVMREWAASAQEAREEMRRVRVPVQPKTGPLLREIRAEYRMVTAEIEAEQKED